MQGRDASLSLSLWISLRAPICSLQTKYALLRVKNEGMASQNVSPALKDSSPFVLNFVLNLVLNFVLKFILKFVLKFVLNLVLNFILNFVLYFVLKFVLNFVLIFVLRQTYRQTDRPTDIANSISDLLQSWKLLFRIYPIYLDFEDIYPRFTGERV